jgi:uncharacterized FlaG/YvyC family protein
MAKELPTSETHTTPTRGTKETHPAYGAITISRPWSSGAITLFGTHADQNQKVSLRLSKAVLKRDLHNDWVHPTETIVEFSMSEAQWAMFATGRGTGEAMPVTLELVPQDYELARVPDIERPIDTRKEQFDLEVKEKLQETLASVFRSVEEIKAMSEGKSVSKVALRHAVKSLENTLTNLPANLQFSVDQFVETTASMVDDAKQEVEAYVLNAAHRVGMKTLKDRADGPTLPLLEGESND